MAILVLVHAVQVALIIVAVLVEEAVETDVLLLVLELVKVPVVKNVSTDVARIALGIAVQVVPIHVVKIAPVHAVIPAQTYAAKIA